MLAFVMPVAMAAITYYFGTFQMSGTIAASKVLFTDGADTSAIGGTVGTGNATFTATGLPMVAGVDIIIDQAVKIKNIDSIAHGVTLAWTSDTFAAECTLIRVILVAPNATEYEAVVLDGSGAVTTTSTSVNMINGTVWVVKIEIHLDDDASVAARAIVLQLSYT